MVSKQYGKMLIEIRVVPNFEAVRRVLKTKTGTDPSPKEIAEYIDGMRKDGQFLPIDYQKIVSMALIYDTPGCAQPKEGNPNSKPWTVSCFAGDESSIIRNFWLRYDQIKSGFGAYPVFVTCDRKRGTLPLVVNRSFALIKAMTTKIIEKYGMLPEEIIKEGEKNPGYKFCVPYRHIRTCLKDILCKEDKWENHRPNYMYTYSTYTTDLASDFSLSGVEENDIVTAESLVLANDWDTLARKTVESALVNWKNFATARYINNDETFIKEAVSEDYLNNPDLAEYMVSKPHANPYDIVVTEFRTEGPLQVPSQETPAADGKLLHAKVLMRKPAQKKPGAEDPANQVRQGEKFPPEQKYIKFEEER